MLLLRSEPPTRRPTALPETSPAAEGRNDPSALCDAAAIRAARESAVPLAVLRAITRTETGRRRDGALRPWPWTVNMEGRGRWFDSRAEMLSYARRHRTRGARSFDMGCFQINYKWHGGAFASLESMADPLTTARYAARFLADLHAELGSWPRAAGAYHSRTPAYAHRYRRRFERIFATLGDVPHGAPATANVPPEVGPEQGFPLFRGTGGPASGTGSLFPRDAPAGRALLSGAAG